MHARYVHVKKFVELTGYSEDAVRSKIAEGVWLERKLWRRAPDGAILMDMDGYRRWVEGSKPREKTRRSENKPKSQRLQLPVDAFKAGQITAARERARLAKDKP
jgi:hypothetical protein